MRKVLLSIILLLFTASSFASLRQASYRWRNDDGNEANASWKAGVNTAITITDPDEILRLRIEFDNDNGEGEPSTLGQIMTYSKDGGDTWINISTSATNDFQLVTSAHVTHGTSTTSQLGTVPGYFTAGKIVSNTSPYVGISLNDGGRSEMEWVIKPTPSCENSTTYLFQLDGLEVEDLKAVLHTNFVACTPKAVIAASNDGPACVGADVAVSVSSDIGECTYSWTGPDGFTSSDSSFILTDVITDQSVWYVVEVTSTEGCISKDSTQVMISADAGVIILNFSDTTICPGSEITILASGAADLTFSWSPTGGAASGDQNEHYLVSPTSGLTKYYATATNPGGCTSTSDTAIVRVDPLPSGITSSNPTVEGASDGSFTISGLLSGAQYKVNYKKDGAASTSPELTASSSGSITVSGLGAGNYTEILVVRISTDCSSLDAYNVRLEDPNTPNNIEGTDWSLYIHHYPNPVKDELLIRFDNEVYQGTHLTLKDINGRIIHTEMNIQNPIVKLDCSQLASGWYMVQIEIQNKVHTIKIIKQ